MNRKLPSKITEVSIELDLDDSGDEADNNAGVDDIEDEVVIEPPIPISAVTCKVPSNVFIKDLTKEVRDFIQTSLDFPPAVSIGSWTNVLAFLDGGDRGERKPMKDYLKPYGNMHAQILLNALVVAERVDMLAKLKIMIANGLFYQNVREVPSNNFNAPISMSGDNNLNVAAVEEKLGYDKTILVIHYETTEQEKKDFTWFMQNMRRNLRTHGGLKVMDIEKLEKADDGNRLRKLEKIYYKLAHIIVCFNHSYLAALCADEVVPNFEFKKMVHDKTVIEYLNNGANNYRCRPVLMPQNDQVRRTDWASVTHKYKFPNDFEALLKRLYQPTKRPKLEVSLSFVPTSAECSRLNSQPPPLNNS